MFTFLSMNFVNAQTTATSTIVADRYANPTLQWQGVHATYQGPNVGWSYFINNGAYLDSKTIATGSEYYYGRYNFIHSSFPNSKITKITITVSCSRDASTTSGPAIAEITVPNCSSVAWSSNANGQNLYSCLNNAPGLPSELSISTNNDGSPTNNTYLIHDPTQGVDISSLWTASATSIAIGLKPWQNAMNINSISMTITYLQDAPIANNLVCCPQTFSASGAPARLYANSGTPTGGTGAYTYQWQSSINGTSWSNISGATASDYYPPTLSQTTYYRRIVSSGAATPNTSAAIKITIYTAITGNTIGNNQSFFNSGNPLSLTPSSTIGGGDGANYSYQWQSCTDNVSFISIPGATGSSYTPPVLSQTTYYRRIASSVGFNSTSNVATISISPGIEWNNICCNQTYINTGDPSELKQTTGTTLNAGSGYAVQWLSSIDNNTYSPISGATALSYDPPITTQSIYYKRQITHSSGIVNTSSVVMINITLDPGVVNNKIGYSQSFISSGDPATFSSIAALSGGNGTYTFQWQYSIDNLNWTSVGTNSSSFDPALLTTTTFFRREIRSGTAPLSYSNTLTVTINAVGSCLNKWMQKTSLNTSRAYGVAFSANNNGYYGLGGDLYGYETYNDFWKYDPVNDTWTQQSIFPGVARINSSSFELNGKFYIGLGQSGGSAPALQKDFYEFNPTTNSWVKKADFPFYVGNVPGFSCRNFGYIITGPQVYSYSPNDISNGTDVNGNPKGAWIQKQNLPIAGNYQAAFSIGNNSYAVVYTASNTYLYQFNPDELVNGCDAKNNPKGAWIPKRNIPAVNFARFLFSLSGKAYFQDGDNGSLIEYNPETDNYSTLNIPAPLLTAGMTTFSINNIGYANFRTGSETSYSTNQQFWQFSLSGITTGKIPMSLKAGNTVIVPFRLTCGQYNTPVVFNVELSDANGSFATARTIGTSTLTSSGSIAAYVPLNIATGSKYRVRVVSISPSEIANDNGVDISITDKLGNTSDLFYNYEDGWQKQWMNKSSNESITGKIGGHTFNDNDIFYSGDFDGDRTQEMLIVSYAGSSNDYMDVVKYINGEWISLWSNNGSSSPGIYPYRNNLIVGDFDGDGKDEILGNDNWTTLFKFSNNNWQWAWSDYGNTSHPMYPYKIKLYAGNFYADGKTQLLGCSSGDWTTMFSWNGSDFVWGWSDYGKANPFRNFRGNMIVGDFNGDGRSDLFGLGPYSAVMFQYNSSNGQYSQVWSSNGANNIAGWTYPFTGTDKLMAANIDSDSKTELILVKKNGPYAYTIDFAGSNGWNSNFQYAFIGDWNVSPPLNTSNSKYAMVKPRASEPSFILTMRKTCGGLYTSSMFKTSTAGFNYRTGAITTSSENGNTTNEIFVYPNPGDKAFDVYIQKGNVRQISVFNYSGEEIYKTENNYVLATLNIESNNWANGIYLIKVLTENNELLTSKIIIQH